MILDCKIGPQKADREMFEFISQLEIPLTIVLNKIDKLSKSDRKASLAHAQEIFF
jgi:GTP-binding protein EngB required for normal cell division